MWSAFFSEKNLAEDDLEKRFKNMKKLLFSVRKSLCWVANVRKVF
jgi:hypothetical protein